MSELTKLEAALAGLAPSAGRLNRDRLLFEAGRRSQPRLGWIASTGAFAALALVLALQLNRQPGPTPLTVDVVQAAPEVEAAPLPAGGYLALRDRVLAIGVEALPALPSVPGDAGELSSVRLGLGPS
jgi:hypothetical protein